MSVLRTHDLAVSFGGVLAVAGVDIAVEPGQVVGLIGPNGAGKTTFVDALTGFVRSRGRIDFDGRDIVGLPAHRRARLGLARTWQSLELFDDLTVAENLEVAARRSTAATVLGDLLRPGRASGGVATAVSGALAALDIGHLADRAPAELSQGQRKLVGVARALAAEPKLLCLDEPAAGLDTVESAVLGDRLRALAPRGTSLVLIDHDMGLVLSLCDHVYVMEFGRVIASGSPSAVVADERVISAYLGERARGGATEALA